MVNGFSRITFTLRHVLDRCLVFAHNMRTVVPIPYGTTILIVLLRHWTLFGKPLVWDVCFETSLMRDRWVFPYTMWVLGVQGKPYAVKSIWVANVWTLHLRPTLISFRGGCEPRLSLSTCFFDIATPATKEYGEANTFIAIYHTGFVPLGINQTNCCCVWSSHDCWVYAA